MTVTKFIQSSSCADNHYTQYQSQLPCLGDLKSYTKLFPSFSSEQTEMAETMMIEIMNVSTGHLVSSTTHFPPPLLIKLLHTKKWPYATLSTTYESTRSAINKIV